MNVGWAEPLFILFIVVFLGTFVWALVDAIRRPESQYPKGRGKTAWIVGLILGWLVALGWLVGIIYLFIVRRAQGPVRATPPGQPPAPPVPPPAPPSA